MKITFLGTNGWYDTPDGNTPSVFVETDDAYVIFDAGFGFCKAKDMIKPGKPAILFISHFHLDHLIGLHTLPLFKIPQGIDVCLPHGGEKVLRAFLRKPFTTPPLFLSTKIRFREISKEMKLPVSFERARLQHSVPCYGFRLTARGITVTYCTDTGLCRNLKLLARSADLLITECAMSPGDRRANLFHITPETAARVAKAAGAKRLALFHFDPGKYPEMSCRREAETAARRIFPDTIAANDGTVITL